MTEPNENMPTTQASFGEPGANIHRYLQIIFKRKWLILSALVVTLGAVAVWTFSRTRIYRSTASVLVMQRAPQVLGSKVNEVVDLSTGTYWQSKEYLATQTKVITSTRLAMKVARKLHLDRDPEFWKPLPVTSKGKPRTLKDAAGYLEGIIRADAVRDANIIKISIEHPGPEMAAHLANGVAQVYISQNVEYKLSSTTGAVKWLSDQLDDLKKQLEKSEMALYQFKKDHNVISISLEDKQSILARKIQKITDALTDIRMKRMRLNSKRKQVVAALNGNKDVDDPLKLAVGQVMENRVVQSLKDVYLTEYRKHVALKEKYAEKYPLVLEQKAKVKAAHRDLKREVTNVLSALESQFREVRDNEVQLAGALQGAKDEALGLNKREVAYQRLKRSQQNTEKLYSLVLTRMKESDLSAQLRVNNIRSLDAAVAAKVPIRPRVRITLAIGALFGLLLGIGLAFLVDALDSTVKSQEDVDQVPGMVFLGLMPKIPGSVVRKRGKRPEPQPELDLIVHRNSKSTVAEACRSIRTNILFASTGRDMKRMVVTSPGPKEGKTTTAVSLAIAMAQAGSKVVIVDTDMRRPRLHSIFGVPKTTGITSLLLGESKIEDAIKTTEIPDLYVLPCGPVPPNPAELCQSERFKTLLDRLGERFDRVILDSPPVMVVTDAVVLGTLVDGTLLVARTGHTSREGIRETVRQLSDVGVKLLGCVLNDMDLQRRGYTYYRYRRYGNYKYGQSRYGYGQYGENEEPTPTG